MSQVSQRTLPVHIRWMIRRDMQEVLDIESLSFEYAWSEEEFVKCLRERNCIGMVAEHDDRIAGYMIYEILNTRLHLLNLAVAPSMRLAGVGRQMIGKLVSKLTHRRRRQILLEVRETNLGAQKFFRNLDFKAISLLRDFYEDTTEDAYLMQYKQQETSGFTPVNRIARLAS
ncbi:ribosomal protein S18-alanine N-acetyltransferase [Bremerella cremea]|nr:ribosomal protein S18-alanine N-acetyltransferase [Bremerella cremea]